MRAGIGPSRVSRPWGFHHVFPMIEIRQVRECTHPQFAQHLIRSVPAFGSKFTYLPPLDGSLPTTNQLGSPQQRSIKARVSATERSATESCCRNGLLYGTTTRRPPCLLPTTQNPLCLHRHSGVSACRGCSLQSLPTPSGTTTQISRRRCRRRHSQPQPYRDRS